MTDYYNNIDEDLSLGMVKTDRVLKYVQRQRSRIEELEEVLMSATMDGYDMAKNDYHKYIAELEAKLEKAVDFIEDMLSGRDRDCDWRVDARTTLAELKGQDYE